METCTIEPDERPLDISNLPSKVESEEESITDEDLIVTQFAQDTPPASTSKRKSEFAEVFGEIKSALCGKSKSKDSKKQDWDNIIHYNYIDSNVSQSAVR